MEIVNVLAAAAGSWIFGAAWYMTLAKPWTEAAGIEVDEDGRPVNESALPYILSALCMVIVAGMMRHMFALSGIAGASKGLIAGLGVGLFFISPWIFINTGYSDRPWKLAVIDSGYAALGCAVIGLVLTLL